MKDTLGDKFDKMVVTATYETTDPTVDSQITTLQASGADVLLVAAIPKLRRRRSVRCMTSTGSRRSSCRTSRSRSVR